MLINDKTKYIFLILIFIFVVVGCATPQLSEVVEDDGRETLKLYLEAQNLSQGGDFDRALEKYREIIRRSPDLAPSARLAIGIVVENQLSAQLLGQRRRERLMPRGESFTDLELETYWQEAINAFADVLKNHPASHEAALALYRLGLIYLDRLGDHHKALEYFGVILDSYPDDDLVIRAQFMIGDSYFRNRDFDQAIKEYLALRLRYPGSPLAEKADVSLKFIRELSSDNRRALSLYVQAEENYRGAKYALAARFYQEALRVLSREGSDDKELEKFAEDLTYYAGESYYRGGDLEETDRSFKNYLKIYPNGRFVAEASLRIADANLAYKRYSQKAVRGYEDYLDKGSDDRAPDAYFKIGYAYREAGQHQLAGDNFLEAKRGYQSNLDSAKVKVADIKGKLVGSQNGEGGGGELRRQLNELQRVIEGNLELKVESGYQAGEAYYTAGEYQKSLQEFQSILRNYRHRDRFKETELKAANLLYRLGNYEEAISAYLWVLVDYPDDPIANEAIFFSAKSYLWLGDVKRALSHFSGLIENGVESPYAIRSEEEIDFIRRNWDPSEEDGFKLYLEATDRYERGSYWLALEGFRETSARYPKSKIHDDALLGQGHSLFARGETDKALGVYREVVDSSDDKEIKIEAYLAMADVLLFDKIDIVRGAAIYLRMIEEYPDDYRSPLFHFKIASYYKEERLYGQAIEEYNNALEVYRRSSSKGKLDDDFLPRTRMALGDLFHQRGDYERASQEYEIVRLDYPLSSLAPKAFFNIGNIHLLAKRYAESIKTYNRLINVYPASILVPQAQFSKASVYDLYLRKFKDAITEYRKLVDLYPDSSLAAQAQYNIGYIYQFKLSESALEEELKEQLGLAD